MSSSAPATPAPVAGQNSTPQKALTENNMQTPSTANPNKSTETPTVVSLPKKRESTGSSFSSKETQLPMARVKTIMKSSPEVDVIAQDGLHTITKATELFIIYLTKLSQKHGSDQELTYADLSSVVNRKESMEFLQDIIPKKIKYSEYLSIMEKENKAEESFATSFY